MTVVNIVATTWFPSGTEGSKRLRIFCEALDSWNVNLSHNDDIYLHVADDGSSEITLDEIKNLVNDHWPKHGTTFSIQNRRGVGASLNQGCQRALTYSDVILYTVDDWKLLKPLDITPWVEFIESKEYDAALVKFFPHPNTFGQIIYANPGIYAMRLNREGFAFSTRPSLWHRRMFDAYGWFPELVNAYDCERIYNLNISKFSWPLLYQALPDEWMHLGGVELGDITP